MPGRIVFGTTKDAAGQTSPTERLRINSDGNTITDYNIKCNNLRGRNLIINGAMTIAQRNTTLTAEGYACDRFEYLRTEPKGAD